MAEIKSAIELAMEKTQGLRLSREEKEKLKEEEVHSRAHSLVNRFLEVDFQLKEIDRELSKYTPEQKQQLEKLMVQYLAAAIQLDRDDNDLPLQGIEAFREEKKGIFPEIRALVKTYEEKKKMEDQKIKTLLMTKLGKLGISGSAVRPKVFGSPEWEEVLAQFRPAFEDQLSILKSRLAA